MSVPTHRLQRPPRPRRWRAAFAGLGAVALALVSVPAFADNIQDSIVDADDSVTLTAGSSTGDTATIRVVGNSSAGDTDSGCNWDPGEDPLVLDVVTPTGVTANPNPVSITSCGTDVPVTFTASSTAVSGVATVTIHSAPAGGGSYLNQVSIPITVVTAGDTTAPVLNLPSNIGPVEATGSGGAVVTYTATATDAVDGSVSVNCDPDSGSTFALGTTTVNCSATDAAGNTANGSFTVTVEDTTAPTLTLPDNITTDATSASGAVVIYTATASDIVDGSVTPVCIPASGSDFTLGTKTVNCSATDAAGNTAEGSFTVTVNVHWNGILQPINANGSSIFKQGSTVPVKFASFAGLTATLRVQKIDNGVEGAVVEAISTAAADTGNQFRYDATAGQYIFNLNTKTLTAGTYLLHIDLGDGVDHTVVISLKK